LQWVAADSGGSEILDYTVSILNEVSQVYEAVKTGITSTSTTITGLQAGTLYKLKVQARNKQGLSDYSAFISILAA
jgi:hypothetical protein